MTVVCGLVADDVCVDARLLRAGTQPEALAKSPRLSTASSSRGTPARSPGGRPTNEGRAALTAAVPHGWGTLVYDATPPPLDHSGTLVHAVTCHAVVTVRCEDRCLVSPVELRNLPGGLREQ